MGRVRTADERRSWRMAEVLDVASMPDATFIAHGSDMLYAYS
jgi:hypothetical protein